LIEAAFLTFNKTLLVIALFSPSLSYAIQANITLDNGDQITAKVIEQDKESVTINHSVLGTLTLDKFKIVSISPTGQEIVSEEIQPNTVVEPEPVQTDNGLFGTGFLQNWERRLDVGLAGSAGKSSNHQINIGFTADLADDESRIAHKTAYFRAESENELSDHSFYTLINKDWLSPDTPWFTFAGARADLDEFKDWDYRLSANGGAGYEFIQSESYLLVGRTGLGFSQTFGGEREEFIPEALLGVESQWKISEKQSLKFANTLYPNLEELSDFRNLTSVDWTMSMDSFAGLALKLGLVNEYDSTTEGDVDKNDFKYTVSLAWTL
jgi:hypothetical protein